MSSIKQHHQIHHHIIHEKQPEVVEFVVLLIFTFQSFLSQVSSTFILPICTHSQWVFVIFTEKETENNE